MKVTDFLGGDRVMDALFIALARPSLDAPAHKCRMDRVTGMCETCCVEMTELCQTCLCRGHHSFWCPKLLADRIEIEELTGGRHSREWYEENDPQSLVDSINAANGGGQ